MNFAEHPIAIDLNRRIAASEAEDKSIPVQIFFPGMGQMMGAVTSDPSIPGLFTMMGKVQIQGTGQEGIMKFTFTADKPITVIHPDSTPDKGKSRIIQ